MRIFIEPMDVLLFRDGKPFSAGDDHLARSLFPPTPMPFQGAIRSTVLAEHGFRFDDQVRGLIGDENGYGKLRMKGPFVARRDEAISEYFPVPADLVQPKDEGEEQLSKKGDQSDEGAGLLTLQTRKPFWKTDLEMPLLNLWAGCPVRCETPRGFLSEGELVRCLLGEAPGVTEPNSFACTESRMGIRRKSSTHSVETGKLYSVAFTRLKEDVGFTLDVEGIPLKEKGLLLLGGESRSARYESIPERTWLKNAEQKIRERIAASKPLRFKVYLATPAFFAGGWLPQGFDQGTLEGNLGGLRLKIKAAAVSRPLPVGGWDLKNRRPKAIRRYVPAGSVYYFEALDPGLTVDDLFAALHFQCLSEEGREIGFGLSLIGGW